MAGPDDLESRIEEIQVVVYSVLVGLHDLKAVRFELLAHLRFLALKFLFLLGQLNVLGARTHGFRFVTPLGRFERANSAWPLARSVAAVVAFRAPMALFATDTAEL
jgi:hypothetical protein